MSLRSEETRYVEERDGSIGSRVIQVSPQSYSIVSCDSSHLESTKVESKDDKEGGRETTPKDSTQKGGTTATPTATSELGKEITPPDGILPIEDSPEQDSDEWTSVQKKRKSVKDSSKVRCYEPLPMLKYTMYPVGCYRPNFTV